MKRKYDPHDHYIEIMGEGKGFFSIKPTETNCILSSQVHTDDAENDKAYMLDLVNTLYTEGKPSNSSTHKMTLKNDNKYPPKLSIENIPLVNESEFSSTVVKSSNIVMDELMQGISDTKGFYSVKKSISSIISGPSVIPDKGLKIETTRTPVSKCVSERSKREVHYQKQSEEISRWIETVKKNREAEFLDFRLKDRLYVTRDQLIGKFTATTLFEKEMIEALNRSSKARNDKLGKLKISLKDYKEQRGKLAKTRALLFYEEQKKSSY